MLLLWNGNPRVEFGVEASCPETWLLRPPERCSSVASYSGNFFETAIFRAQRIARGRNGRSVRV